MSSWRIEVGDVLERLREMPDGSVLAYLAGVVDSDGTIGVKCSTYAMRHGNGGAPNYSERICVKQVEPDAVDLLHQTFGGYRGISRPSAARGRALHTWQVTDLRAATAAALLLPYLRIKKRQAENCLRLRLVKEWSKVDRVAPGRGHAGARRRSPRASSLMEKCRRRAQALNTVGVA